MLSKVLKRFSAKPRPSPSPSSPDPFYPPSTPTHEYDEPPYSFPSFPSTSSLASSSSSSDLTPLPLTPPIPNDSLVSVALSSISVIMQPSPSHHPVLVQGEPKTSQAFAGRFVELLDEEFVYTDEPVHMQEADMAPSRLASRPSAPRTSHPRPPPPKKAHSFFPLLSRSSSSLPQPPNKSRNITPSTLDWAPRIPIARTNSLLQTVSKPSFIKFPSTTVLSSITESMRQEKRSASRETGDEPRVTLHRQPAKRIAKFGPGLRRAAVA